MKIDLYLLSLTIYPIETEFNVLVGTKDRALNVKVQLTSNVTFNFLQETNFKQTLSNEDRCMVYT